MSVPDGESFAVVVASMQAYVDARGCPGSRSARSVPCVRVPEAPDRATFEDNEVWFSQYNSMSTDAQRRFRASREDRHRASRCDRAPTSAEQRPLRNMLVDESAALSLRSARRNHATR
jgi:hypothetical protein